MAFKIRRRRDKDKRIVAFGYAVDVGREVYFVHVEVGIAQVGGVMA